MTYWSVYCMEDTWPGLWRIWEELQVVTCGWPPADGWRYDGSGKADRGWGEVRKKLARFGKGDKVVVRLPGNRIGRIGEVIDVRVRDEEWFPVIKRSPIWPHGEQGRQVLVRWDLVIGPPNREWACNVPEGVRLSRGRLRRAIAELEGGEFESLKEALSNGANWDPVAGRFLYERALSDFIATFPDRLEAGLRPYPVANIREYVPCRGKRMDVFLQDEQGKPVVVECKRGTPSADDVEQLRLYMRHVEEKLQLSPGQVRGILVFGGSPNVSQAIAQAALSASVELFAYQMEVTFNRSAHWKGFQ